MLRRPIARRLFPWTIELTLHSGRALVRPRKKWNHCKIKKYAGDRKAPFIRPWRREPLRFRRARK